MLGLLSMPRLMLVFVPPEGTTIDGSGFLIWFVVGCVFYPDLLLLLLDWGVWLFCGFITTFDESITVFGGEGFLLLSCFGASTVLGGDGGFILSFDLFSAGLVSTVFVVDGVVAVGGLVCSAGLDADYYFLLLGGGCPNPPPNNIESKSFSKFPLFLSASKPKYLI